jgi:hypothetical protein
MSAVAGSIILLGSIAAALIVIAVAVRIAPPRSVD